MKLILASLILVVGLFVHAKDKQEHREHGAHKHGAAKMSIAFEGLKGKITLELASSGVYGFEYIPKKESDKQKQKSGLELLEKEISSMIVFDANLKCAILKDKIEVDQHEGGKHSDIDASFNVVCEKDPIGSVLTFNIQKVFPLLTDVDVQVLVQDIQKSVEANRNGFTLELKNK
ncbi:MAG: DUF2796 domain-containing protein [Pseudobdellovibrio sp.]